MAKKTLSGSKPEKISYTLIGITTHLKDYRLAFQFNAATGFGLTRTSDLVTSATPDNPAQPFSLYHWKDEDHFLQYFLLSNRTEGSFLFSEFRNYDYLLLTEGPVRKPLLEKLLKQLRLIPNVVAAFELPLTQAKNYQPVLSDLELHFINQKRERSNQHV